MRIDYAFSGNLFSSYGVHISLGSGLLGKPRRKDVEIYEYPDEDGHIPDLTSVTYDSREIILSCFIVSDNVDTLISTYNDFTGILYEQTSLKELILIIDGINRLTYNCYVKDISELNKQFKNGKNAGTFTIKFIEPQPNG
jgi:hypothetical protein